MKYTISLFLFALLFSNNAIAQNNASLAQYTVVPLNKAVHDGAKVLAGVANIRFKPNVISNSSSKIPQDLSMLLSIGAQDFEIIDCYLSDANKVSSQKARFDKYSAQQQKRILETESILSRTFIVHFPPAIDVTDFCQNIVKKYPNIELAEPYYVAQIQGVPDDPEVSRQTLLSIIKAFEAWDICEGSDSVLIGVGDTGCNVHHQDLGESAIAFNYKEVNSNQQDDDNNGYVDDHYGYNFAWLEDGGPDYYNALYNSSKPHGMQVIGIIGARTNNGFGIAGVSNKCKIVPIKISAIGSDICMYGYQSMIYAAARGCKVLNCSWGSGIYSFVNQSIVDYAIACGVSIVAASGNWFSDLYSDYYPASYYGVLGTGSINNNDVLNMNYVHGAGLRITSSDESIYSLSGSQNIVSCSRGTSFASPAVAGVTAIVRSYLPDISAMEATEIVRMSADNIRNNNNNNGFVPGRVNMLNALKFDYQNIPSIIVKEQYYEDMAGNKQEQFYAEDTATLVLNVINILGNASNVKLSLQLLHCADLTAFTMLSDTNDIGTIEKLNKNEETKIKIKFIAHKPGNIRNLMYLLKMDGLDNNLNPFKDNFKIRIHLSENITTMRNDSLIVAVVDNGKIGYENINEYIREGAGFEHIKYGSHLFEAGFIATTNLSKVVSTNLDANIPTFYNDFDAVYGAMELDSTYRNIITDTKLSASARLGLEVTIDYSFPTKTMSALKMNIAVKNVSNDFFENFSMGQFYDWDVNNHEYNRVEYFAEGIPDFLNPQTAAAEIVFDVHNTVYVGSLAFINTDKYPNVHVTPQATGASSNYFYSNKQAQINALSDGITGQITDTTDVNYIVGLRFNDGLSSQSSAECVVCTGVGQTKEALAQTLADCARSEINSIKESNPNTDYNITYYNEQLTILLSDNLENYATTVNIYNLLGEKLMETNINAPYTSIDLSTLQAGAYFIRLHSSKLNNNKTHSTIIIKN